MSDVPPGGPPPTAGPTGPFPAPAPAGWWPPMPVRRLARWPTFVTLLIALIALGVAVGAWLRPMPEASPPPVQAAPTFSDQQVADAKGKVCTVYEKVRYAVRMNASRVDGDDANTQLLFAINARQIIIAGSAALLTTLAQEPATPPELASAVRKLANLYQTITLDGLASDLSTPAHDDANETGYVIQRLCA